MLKMKFKLPENRAITINGHRYVSRKGVIEVKEDDMEKVKSIFKLREVRKRKEEENGKISAKASPE